MKKLRKLLRAVRKASGYDRGYLWEPGMDFGKDNPNYPYKPTGFSKDLGQPQGEALETRADNWDGGMGDWNSALQHARVGLLIDFYVSNREELETNIEVWIKSETEAWWADCHGEPRLVTI